MDAILKGVDRLVAVVVGAIVAASAASVCLNVFYRYALSSGLVWADEIPGYFLVWIAFLGAYLAIRGEGHIAFDMFVEKLPEGPRQVAQTVIDLVVVGFLAVLLVLSIDMIAVVGNREIETAEIPQGVFMAVLPISAGLMILGLLARILSRWRG